MAVKTKLSNGTRARLKADVAYRVFDLRQTALAGSVVVVDSANSTGGVAVRQTILGRTEETHCFFTRVDNLEVIA